MNEMNGVVNVLKPPGMTSFDVVKYLRGLFGTRKIGHAGTLDPLAAGVLPVCVGRATKAIEFIMDKDKLYRTELVLGIATDTQDSSGKILSSNAPVCTDIEIESAVNSFIGIYLQTPPMYSAIRVGGKRLYDIAREGKEIEREPRKVEIYSASVLDIDKSDGIKVLMDVNCSKGTYIRTLCADIGDRLNCGGHMSFLLRKRAGSFDVSSSITLEELSQKHKEGGLHEVLVKVDEVFNNMPEYRLNECSDKRFTNGVPIEVSREGSINQADNRGNNHISKESLSNYTIVRVYGARGDFIALGTVYKNKDGKYLKVKKFF